MAQRKITSATGRASCIWAPAIVALTILGFSTAASGVEVYRITNPACKVTDSNPNPACGAIVYANKGAYVVNPVKLKSKTTQPFGPIISPDCGAIDYVVSKNVAVTEYVTFVVPADCAFNLKINIAAGPKKDRDLFLTPGCQLIASTDGTIVSSSWHIKTSWTDKAKKQAQENGVTLPEPPQDNQGYKCGKLGKI